MADHIFDDPATTLAHQAYDPQQRRAARNFQSFRQHIIGQRRADDFIDPVDLDAGFLDQEAQRPLFQIVRRPDVGDLGRDQGRKMVVGAPGKAPDAGCLLNLLAIADAEHVGN